MGQSSHKDLTQMSKEIEAARKKLDSEMKASDSMLARSTHLLDSASLARQQEQNNKNLSYFVKEYNEQQRKREQQMWLRIGLGIALLVLLLIGLFRKRKKNSRPEFTGLQNRYYTDRAG